MDVSCINPFIAATAKLFETMIKVPIHLGKPTLRKPDDRLFKLYQLSAVIEISGSISGRVVISLSNQVAMTLAEGLVGQKFLIVNADVLDAVSEIANMISGGAKSALPDAKEVRLSLPVVVATNELPTPTWAQPIILIPFDTAAGRFVIETSFNRQAPEEPPAKGAVKTAA